jgi:putative hydrolase of the HAD superfamily
LETGTTMNKLMNTIRAVYFDAVGTLIHPEPAAPVIYAEAAGRFGSRYSLETIAQRFGRAILEQDEIDRAGGWITSAQRERERWRSIVGAVLDDVADPAGCFDFLYSHFASALSWRCEPGAEALFEDLLARGYHLGLASNFDERLYTLMPGLKPLQYLAKNIVVSFEVGFRKPAPEFFKAMCRRMGLEAEHILHVGDEPENDCAGAMAAGMQAVLFDPRGRHCTWPEARVGNLRDARKLLNHAIDSGS